MRLARRRITETHVDLTPMVDVVLLLVVFFMLTTHFARSQQTPMELPQERGQKERQENRASLVIDLTADGRFVMTGAPTTLQSIVHDVERERAAAGGMPDIIVRADRTASAAHLNALADTLARAGIRNWKLATVGEGSP
jgi:biopolymer transport protein ExbD